MTFVFKRRNVEVAAETVAVQEIAPEVTTEVVETKVEMVTEVLEPSVKEAVITISVSQLQEMISKAVEAAVNPIKEELAELKERQRNDDQDLRDSIFLTGKEIRNLHFEMLKSVSSSSTYVSQSEVTQLVEEKVNQKARKWNELTVGKSTLPIETFIELLEKEQLELSSRLKKVEIENNFLSLTLQRVMCTHQNKSLMDDMINMMENILGYHPLDNSIPPEKKEKPKYKSEKKVLEFKSRPVNLA